MKPIRSTLMKTTLAWTCVTCIAAAVATLPLVAHSATPAAKATPGMRLNPQPLPPVAPRPVRHALA